MIQAGRTFRIFVSSTFSDMKEERNALQKYVFPQLRELCMQHGCRFQAIDLRWGMSEEAGLDQQTMKVCFDEIARSQKTSKKPNFIILLGDRYGWQPVPSEVPAVEFDEILKRVSYADREFLLWKDEQPASAKGWYRKDENAVPSVYCLQPRTGTFIEYSNWEKVETKLRLILRKAVDSMDLDNNARLKYIASATEQEIFHGVLNPPEGVPDAKEHVFGFFRHIDNLDEVKHNAKCQPDFSLSPGNKKDKPLPTDFIDVMDNKEYDSVAEKKLKQLKKVLEEKLGDNIQYFSARWNKKRKCLSNSHIGKLPNNVIKMVEHCETIGDPNTLCVAVWNCLYRVIMSEIAKLEEIDPIKKEITDHADWGKKLTNVPDGESFFIGRADMLKVIERYLSGLQQYPLAIYGESGSGKTALIARGAEEARTKYDNAKIVVRFIGATPDSSDGRQLLRGLCEEISSHYGLYRTTIQHDYRELIKDFSESLGMATEEHPLILFIDALDQLSDSERARHLAWLPETLPENAYLIVSTLSGKCLTALQRKLPPASLVQLLPMNKEEGRALLQKWLDNKERRLLKHQNDEIIDKFTSNGLPLYLKLAFEQAVNWKSYTDPAATTLAGDIMGIIRDLFRQLSQEKNHGMVMVSRSLGYLAAAKNGLSEDELLDVLSEDRTVLVDFKRRSPKSSDVDRLPVVVWSRLYFDLEPYLTNRSADGTTLLTFYHRQLVKVAVADYLDGDIGWERHKELAHYFETRWQEPCVHALNELPFQLAECGQYQRLSELFTDIRYLHERCSHTNVYELIRDYSLIRERGNEGYFQYRDFIRYHAQRLTTYKDLFFTLINHEGFPDAKEKARSLIDQKLWNQPWLRFTPAWDIAEKQNNKLENALIIQSEYRIAPSPTICFAVDRHFGFFLKELGQISVVDLESGIELSKAICIKDIHPLRLACSISGKYLAIAYNNGTIDIIRLEFDERCVDFEQVILESVDFLVPAFELPVIEFINNNFWYQAPDSSIKIFSLIDREISTFETKTKETYASELSGIASFEDIVVISLRSADGTYLISTGQGDKEKTKFIPEIDVTSLCLLDHSRLAVAYTNYTVTVLDVFDEFEKLNEAMVDELPVCLAVKEDVIVLVSELGSVHSWIPGFFEGPCPVILPGEERLISPKSIYIARDGTFLLITGLTFLSFLIEKVSTSREKCLFINRIRDGFHAVVKRDDGMWFLNGELKKESLIFNRTINTEINLPYSKDLFFQFAEDGEGCLLCYNMTLKLFFEFSTGLYYEISGYPSNFASACGHVGNGFWVADRAGGIYYANKRGCFKLFEIDRAIEGPPLLQSWSNLLVWTAHCNEYFKGIGVDTVPLQIFFEIYEGDNQPVLKKIGSRLYSKREGNCNLKVNAYDPSLNKFCTVWGRNTPPYVVIKMGNPLEIVDRMEQEYSLSNLSVNVSHIGIISSEILSILSDKGELFYLNITSNQLVSAFSGSLPITDIAFMRTKKDRPVIVEGNSSMFFADLVGGEE